MIDPIESFADLLRLRDMRRAGAPSPEIDRIVVDELKDKMVSALRTALDELAQVPCEHSSALSARVNVEIAWIRAAIETFGGAAQ